MAQKESLVFSVLPFADINLIRIHICCIFEEKSSFLYNLRARQYDPNIGRFITRDTYPYNYQNPIELNRYTYSQNNPATYTDPSGYTSLITYAKRVTTVVLTPGAVLSGLANGIANVALDYLFSFMFMSEYNGWDAATSFGEGFIGGVVSYHLGYYVAGKVISKLAQLFADVAIGVSTDVFLRGEDPFTSLIFNLGSSSLGLGLEALGRRAAP